MFDEGPFVPLTLLRFNLDHKRRPENAVKGLFTEIE